MEKVEEVKRLLEEGYKITQISHSFKKEGNKNIAEDKISLRKGEDIKEISAVNSPEFFEFVIHFKKVKDTYNNNEFIYIQDLKSYNEAYEKLSQEQTYIKDKHKIKISGREFIDGITIIFLKPGSQGNNKGHAMFLIDVEQNKDFFKADLKDEVEIYEKENNNLVFRGLVKEYSKQDEKTALVISQDITLKMETEKMSAEFVNMNPADCVSILVSSMGLGFKPSGINYNTSEREFMIIMPIRNLIINKKFNIGEVEFYQDFSTEDDALIRKSENGLKNLEWNGNIPRAKIRVKEKQFLPAIKEGYNKISQAIDIICLRSDFSSPILKTNDKTKDLSFNYYRLFTRVKIPTWVYCREINTKAFCIYNLESIAENILSLEYWPEEYFQPIKDSFEKLITKNKDSLTQEENNLLQALHWLRRAIQIGNNKDKLLDLWTSMEFLISGFKIDNLFSDKEKNKLKGIVSNTDFSQDQKNAIYSKIGMLNDAPLMSRIKEILKSLNIDITDEEYNLLKSARNKRRDIIHGLKDEDVSEKELNKLRTIIESILLAKVGKL